MIAYYFAHLMSRLACLLPRSVAELLGKGLGVVGWQFVPGWRKDMARENIMLCLGVDESEADRIARESMVRFGPMLMEVLRFRVIKAHMEDYVDIHGLDYLREAAKHGGGVLAAAHSGNWEFLGGIFAQQGIPTVGVAMKQHSTGFNKFIHDQRVLMDMHITYKDNVREMYDMLSKGWFIGLIMDQDVSRRDGIVLEFFQRPTNCAVGAATMARFKDAPILPTFIHRDRDGKHHVSVLPPIRVERTRDKREDIRRVTQEIARLTEEHIRTYPEEWFWLHDRWKSMRDD